MQMLYTYLHRHTSRPCRQTPARGEPHWNSTNAVFQILQLSPAQSADRKQGGDESKSSAQPGRYNARFHYLSALFGRHVDEQYVVNLNNIINVCFHQLC